VRVDAEDLARAVVGQRPRRELRRVSGADLDDAPRPEPPQQRVVEGASEWLNWSLFQWKTVGSSGGSHGQRPQEVGERRRLTEERALLLDAPLAARVEAALPLRLRTCAGDTTGV
jgi:hypothetical protein